MPQQHIGPNVGRNYRVRIEIDVQADSFREAAQLGLEGIKRLSSPVVEVAYWGEDAADASDLGLWEEVEL